jgi:hypothetical protein
MDRINNRIAHVYGYAVCLAAVVVMFFSVKQIIDSSISLSDPLRADMGGYNRMGVPLTNFDLFKLEWVRVRRYQFFGPPGTPAPALSASDTSEAELRRLYDAERAAAIDSARFRAIRLLLGNLFLFIFAGLMFGIHWRWLKQQDAVAVTT